MQNNLSTYTDKQYVQIKLTKMMYRQDWQSIVQIIDISGSIMYDQEQAQSSFLALINATVSHELQNPLNSILAQNVEKTNLYQEMSEIVQQMDHGSEDYKKANKIMEELDIGQHVQESSTSTMFFMVKDLLDFGLIKSGNFQKILSIFDIRDTVRKVNQIQKQQATEHNLELIADFSDLSERRSLIYSDEQRIMQVLLCLQTNAIKFTNEGSVNVHVSISDDRYLQIRIQDTGIGISKEDQKKLFKLFGLVNDKKQQNTGGIGIGLMIAKQICLQFEGNITCESELDVGSIFTLSMKLDSEQRFMEEGEQREFQLNSNKLEFTWVPELCETIPKLKYVFNLNGLATDQTFNQTVCSQIFDEDEPLQPNHSEFP